MGDLSICQAQKPITSSPTFACTEGVVNEQPEAGGATKLQHDRDLLIVGASIGGIRPKTKKGNKAIQANAKARAEEEAMTV